jgi:hypothetical protein
LDFGRIMRKTKLLWVLVPGGQAVRVTGTYSRLWANMRFRRLADAVPARPRGETRRPPITLGRRSIAAALAVLLALWCRSAAPDELTTISCRDREDPSVGATLIFDLARKRLVSASGVGDTIWFRDRDVPIAVTPAAITWETAHNTYTLNRVTLELGVAGRVYVCQLAKRQL